MKKKNPNDFIQAGFDVLNQYIWTMVGIILAAIIVVGIAFYLIYRFVIVG